MRVPPLRIQVVVIVVILLLGYSGGSIVYVHRKGIEYYQPDEEAPPLYILSNRTRLDSSLITVFFPALFARSHLTGCSFYKEAQYEDGGWGCMELV